MDIGAAMIRCFRGRVLWNSQSYELKTTCTSANISSHLVPCFWQGTNILNLSFKARQVLLMLAFCCFSVNYRVCLRPEIYEECLQKNSAVTFNALEIKLTCLARLFNSPRTRYVYRHSLKTKSFQCNKHRLCLNLSERQLIRVKFCYVSHWCELKPREIINPSRAPSCQ